jgi:preprotein translocase subunit SecG
MGVQVPPSAPKSFFEQSLIFRGMPAAEVQFFMIWLIGTFHVLVCIFLIAVILLQQGKSADLAGAFGGQGSQTAFGPRGATNLLTKMTTWAAIIFVLTSIGLTVLIQRTGGSRSVLEGVHSTTSAPVKPAKPAK